MTYIFIVLFQGEFNNYHEENTKSIVELDSRLPVGWATKLINIYLKTRAYIGKEGSLKEMLFNRSRRIVARKYYLIINRYYATRKIFL